MKKTIAVWMLLAPAICLAQPPSRVQTFFPERSGGALPLCFSRPSCDVPAIGARRAEVRVRVGTGFDMAKEADGLWYGTTTPLPEGFHYYMVNIDGSSVSDPATGSFFGGGQWSSAIEIPAADAEFYSHKRCRMGRCGTNGTFRR